MGFCRLLHHLDELGDGHRFEQIAIKGRLVHAPHEHFRLHVTGDEHALRVRILERALEFLGTDVGPGTVWEVPA